MTLVASGAHRLRPARAAAEPVRQREREAWNTSVPTTRCGVSRKNRISASPISAPLPTEVTPEHEAEQRPTAMRFVPRVSRTVARSRSCTLGTPRASPAT